MVELLEIPKLLPARSEEILHLEAFDLLVVVQLLSQGSHPLLIVLLHAPLFAEFHRQLLPEVLDLSHQLHLVYCHSRGSGRVIEEHSLLKFMILSLQLSDVIFPYERYLLVPLLKPLSLLISHLG
jgi:hypothetical protein